MQTKVIERYFFFGLLLTTFIFSFFIFRPFWIVLVLGVSFAIVLYPIYEWLNEKGSPSSLSSLLTVILFSVMLCGPLLGIGVIIFNQSQDLYHAVGGGGNVGPFLDSIGDTINRFLPQGVSFDIQTKASEFISYVSGNVANIFSATLSAFFSFILMLLIVFYCLKDGTRWKRAIVILSPLGDKDDEKIMERLSVAVNGVIMGNLLIAFAQGILMGFGLWIFGIPNPAVWGLIAAVTSLVPTIGTAFVSVPAILFLFFIGHTSAAIGLFIWAAVVVGMVDNFLSPMVIGGKTKIPPILILFSILGGISFLGPVGVLLGPLTISMLYTLISIYRNEFRETIL